MNPRSDILAEAETLVNGDRNADYGDPNQDFQRTATMWSVYVNAVADRQSVELSDVVLEPHDVAWMMVLLKASRSTTSPRKRDHYADAAGYIACGWDCVS